jgi:glutamate/tyrosine decarboxylase-like PLP-dependent enzyme
MQQQCTVSKIDAGNNHFHFANATDHAHRAHHAKHAKIIRKLLPAGVEDKLRPNWFRAPIILYSRAAHYSISKIKDLLEIHSPSTFMSTVFGGEDADTASGINVKPSECFDALQSFPAEAKVHGDDQLTGARYKEIFGHDDTFPDMIPVHEDGTMNLEALRFMVRFFFSLGNPVIVVANLGTTFTGTHDDAAAMATIIETTPGCHCEGHRQDADGFTHVTRRNYYIHVDGALGGAYVPFFEQKNRAATVARLTKFLDNYAHDPRVLPYLYHLKRQNDLLHAADPTVINEDPAAIAAATKDDALAAQQVPLDKIVLPTFTFRDCPGVMSVAMSGHKFIGAPAPSGVAMTLRKYQLDFFTSGISYISTRYHHQW